MVHSLEGPLRVLRLLPIMIQAADLKVCVVALLSDIFNKTLCN